MCTAISEGEVGPNLGGAVPENFARVSKFLLVILATCFAIPARAYDECLPVDFIGACTANQTCFQSFDWLAPNITNSERTGNKGFQCGIPEDGPALLQNLFVPDQALVNCASSNCTFTLALVDYPNLVRCEQGGCVQTGQIMTCESLLCDCDNDPGCQSASPVVRALTSSATGSNVFDCTTTPNDTSLYHACVLEIPNFVVSQRTPLICRTGQCVDTYDLSGGVVLSNNTRGDLAVEFLGQPVNSELNAVISAIPTMVLVLLASAILSYFFLLVANLYKVDAEVAPVVVGNGTAVAAVTAGARDASASDATTHSATIAGTATTEMDLLEFRISATARLSSHALQRRLGNVRGRTKLSLPGLGNKGDVEVGSSEARRAVAQLHVKESQPGLWSVLDACAGFASSGTVTGILGPSGCGKTTLLSALSGAGHASLKSLHVTGNVTWNGNPIHQTASIAFVPQMDSLIPTMTVREQLLFVARLKNPSMEVSDVRTKVKGVLEELGIDDIADQYVGGTSTRGISGGERRRVMIGTALVSSPRMIILDEPLSGLDSYNALVVTSTLRSLADRGRIVLYSLHQPSNDIYLSLDVAIFMAHGRIVYQGPPAECGTVLHDAGVDTSDPKKAKLLADIMLYALNDPNTCRSLMQAGSSQEKENADPAKMAEPSSIKHETPSIGLQASTVFYRTLMDIWRNKSLLVLHICIAIIAGLLAGGIFYDLGYDTMGVQGRYGGIFVSLCFLAFTSLTTVDLFMAERDVVTAEVNSGLYYDWVYCICKLLADGLLLRALPAVLYAVPFYWMAGFRDEAASWFAFMFILMLFSLCIGALSILVVICSRTAGTASFVMNTVLLLQLAFTGFLVNVNSITPVLAWIHWLSQFFYAFEAMIQDELNGGQFDLVVSAPGIDALVLPDTAGEVFIDTLGYDTQTSTRNIGILIAFYYGFCLFAALAFHVRTHSTSFSHLHTE